MQLLKTMLTILLVAFNADICYAFTKMPAKESTSESCPAENIIVQIHATYTAPGGWIGQVQSTPGKIRAFEQVLYKPNDTKHPFEAGQLLHCSYSLDNNKYVDLRLPQSHNQARINNPKNWEAIYDGYQYFCNKSRWSCVFKLTHKIKQD